MQPHFKARRLVPVLKDWWPLRDAFLAFKRRAAPGVDGTTWQDYEADLEGNVE